MRARVIAYALLALAVPLPASAVTGGDAEPDAGLTVSAGLDSCGIAADTVVCKIDASWNDIAGAERYTASVTRADGSVVDYGDAGAGGSSFWVPYVGNGTYTVTVSAYGTPPGTERARVLAKDTAGTGHRSAARGRDGAVAEPSQPAEVEEPARGNDAPPSCEPEPEPEPADGDSADEPAAEREPASVEQAEENAATLSEARAALDRTAEAPESVECPEPDAG